MTRHTDVTAAMKSLVDFPFTFEFVLTYDLSFNLISYILSSYHSGASVINKMPYADTSFALHEFDCILEFQLKLNVCTEPCKQSKLFLVFLAIICMMTARKCIQFLKFLFHTGLCFAYVSQIRVLNTTSFMTRRGPNTDQSFVLGTSFA